MACVYVYVIILTFLGPEKLGQSFDVDHDDDLAEATGTTAIGASTGKQADRDEERGSSEVDPFHKPPLPERSQAREMDSKL